jgi:hypothetical protein
MNLYQNREYHASAHAELLFERSPQVGEVCVETVGGRSRDCRGVDVGPGDAQILAGWIAAVRSGSGTQRCS